MELSGETGRGPVAQLAEAQVLKTCKYGFESRLAHSCRRGIGGRFRISEAMMSETPHSPSDLHERVAQVINGIRPYIQGDGGDIELVGVEEDGTVKVRLTGACSGCPHATMTLKRGVERALREHVPEIREVIHV
jgi:Fe-S cluster biogenesis protein NfuA